MSRRRLPLFVGCGIGLLGVTLLLALPSGRQSLGAWLADRRPLPEDRLLAAVAGVERNGDWTPAFQPMGGLGMALVPAGCFRMGSTDAELAVALDSCDAFYGAGRCSHDFAAVEQPAHQVCFERPFWIGRTEVTNREYGSTSSTGMDAMDRGPDWPRETVDWGQAQAFCRSRGLRLPTEEEWEYAARGPDGWIFPWGNVFDLENVISGRLAPQDVATYRDVASWVGTTDQSGGVAEWVDAWFAPYAADDAVSGTAVAGGLRIARGGSWFSYAAFMLRSAQRESLPPEYASSVVGFRCAADFE